MIKQKFHLDTYKIYSADVNLTLEIGNAGDYTTARRHDFVSLEHPLVVRLSGAREHHVKLQNSTNQECPTNLCLDGKDFLIPFREFEKIMKNSSELIIEIILMMLRNIDFFRIAIIKKIVISF